MWVSLCNASSRSAFRRVPQPVVLPRFFRNPRPFRSVARPEMEDRMTGTEAARAYGGQMCRLFAVVGHGATVRSAPVPWVAA
jgi:hypothetical protein